MTTTNYKPSNARAFTFLLIPASIAFAGSYLTLNGILWMYITGQILLSLFFLQTFILLHECGHYTYFKSTLLNIVFGNIFGILSGIPFYTWRHMHFLHHLWTGWRDKDPTTERTIEPSSSGFLRIVANVSWRLFVPLFFLSYSYSNYWNLKKMKRFLSPEKFPLALLGVILYIIFYIAILYVAGYQLMMVLLPAFIISLVWKELVIMTQHSHIEIPVSNGEDVKPVSTMKQIDYTRSFYISPFLSQYFLFGFNLHELHHANPRIPAYWLQRVDMGLEKKPRFFEWFAKAKSMKGEDYVFRTWKHTGKKF